MIEVRNQHYTRFSLASLCGCIVWRKTFIYLVWDGASISEEFGLGESFFIQWKMEPTPDYRRYISAHFLLAALVVFGCTRMKANHFAAFRTKEFSQHSIVCKVWLEVSRIWLYGGTRFQVRFLVCYLQWNKLHEFFDIQGFSKNMSNE